MKASIIYTKYHTVSVRMLFRECNCKNVGVAGYAEAFTIVLSEKQTGETDGYLVWIILVHHKLNNCYIRLENFSESAYQKTQA